MKNNILFLFLLCFSVLADSSGLTNKLSGQYSISTGKLTYKIRFLLKNIIGQSVNVKGRGICKDTTCEFLIAVPVKSFISKDSNRDMKMLNVLRAGENPMVTARLVTNSSFGVNSKINFEINLAGQKKTFKNIDFTTTVSKERLKITGHLIISLSDFKIERPSLLMVKIDDTVKIEVNLEFKK